MKKFQLNHQADVIESVLAAHKIQGKVWGGAVTPRFVRFDLTTALGTRVNKVLTLREEVAMRLGVPDIRLYRKGDAIRVEVPRADAAVVRFDTLRRRLPAMRPLTAVLGVDEEGAPLLLNFASPDVAHVLVAGTTGSGKTLLLKTLLLSLALYNPQNRLQLALIDPKARGFAPLAQLPHLIRPIETDPHRAVSLLEGMVVEMVRRDRNKISRPAILVAIDELADLRMVAGKRVENALARLTQRGREAGIHLILATQRPAAAIVGGMVKANLPVRLVGAVASPEDAKVATGMAGSGANRLRGRGDFLLVARQETVRFQAPFASDGTIRTLIETETVRWRHGDRSSRARTTFSRSFA
jgi:S-DNA-T family DNA segregation ATPase FtsK/SpoIIIE